MAKNEDMPRKISFLTTKRTPKRVNITFDINKRKKISFLAVKRIPKKIKVNFYENRVETKETKDYMY